MRKRLRKRLFGLLLIVTLLTGSISSVQAGDVSEVWDGQTVQRSGDVKNTDEKKAEAEGTDTEITDVKSTETGNAEAGSTGTQNPDSGNAEADSTGMQTSDAKSIDAASAKHNTVEPAASLLSEEQLPDEKAALTGYGMTVTLQIEAYGETIEQGIAVTMPDTYKTFEDYGLTGIKEPDEPGYTVLHVMAQYCEDTYGEGSASYLISTGGGFVGQFLDLPRKSTIMFLKNHKDLQVGAQQEKVQTGDLVSVVDIWANSSWTAGGQYGWFETPDITAEADRAFLVKLSVTPLMWGEAANPAGAEVQVLDNSGNLVTKGETDANGTVFLTVENPGTYTLTAERRTGSYDTDLSYPWDLVGPHGTLTVTPGKTLTDEEAVNQAGELLKSQLSDMLDLNQLTGDFALPVTGSYQTQIDWSSSDSKFIKMNGSQAKVTRPVGADQAVTLTAVITRNTGKSKAAAQAVITIPATVVGKALFEKLTVDQGILEYNKSIDSYTIYAKKDVEKLKISGTAGEGVSVIRCDVKDQKGNLKTDTKITAVDLNFETETCLTAEDEKDLVPQTVTLNAMGTTAGTVTIQIKRGSPGQPLPELPDVTWGQHLGDKDNNAVVNAKTPTGETETMWESFSNAPDSYGSVYAGTPILVNSSIYAVRNHKIERLSAKTGEVEASTALDAPVGYYSNIIYGGGMIFVPLGDGNVQCFDARTLESLYLLISPAPLLTTYQVYGAMHYEDGRIYIGYSDGAWVGPKGCYAAYDTMDVDIDSQTEPVTPLWVTEGGAGQSYYGSGAVTVEGKVIVAGDSGVVHVYAGEDGAGLSSVTLDGMVRGPLVYAQGYVWAATNAGKLYKLSVSGDGKLTVMAKASLPLSTNASPAVVSGKVYITGGTFDDGGFFAVYDMDLNLLGSAKTKQALNTPTVTTAYDHTYVYFTENGESGSLYMAEVTANNKITVAKIYTPTHLQYCMSKVIAGPDGTLYYGNDSGYLFAVRAKTKATPEGGKDNGDEPDSEETGSGNNSSGKDDTDNKNLSPVTLSPQKLTPTKKMTKVNASVKKDTTAAEDLIKAIEQSSEKNETTLTIHNPPEVIDAEVFAELAKYPKLRLILDCGNYTLSIKGKDVTDVNASLNTTLTELEDNLSEKEGEKYKVYQRIALTQEGAFPGELTVVYQLADKFKDIKELYVYDLSKAGEVTEAVVQQPYAMFSLSHAGEYILAEQNVETLDTTGAKSTDQIEEAPLPVKEKRQGIPPWAYLLLGLGIGAAVSGIVTAKVLHTRKRKETWEE